MILTRQHPSWLGLTEWQEPREKQKKEKDGTSIRKVLGLFQRRKLALKIDINMAMFITALITG
jgi:hypothetical protein